MAYMFFKKKIDKEHTRKSLDILPVKTVYWRHDGRARFPGVRSDGTWKLSGVSNTLSMKKKATIKSKWRALLPGMLLFLLPQVTLADEWDAVGAIGDLFFRILDMFLLSIFSIALIWIIHSWVKAVSTELKEKTQEEKSSQPSIAEDQPQILMDLSAKTAIYFFFTILLSLISLKLVQSCLKDLGLDFFIRTLGLPFLLGWLLISVLSMKNFTIWYIRAWKNLSNLEVTRIKLSARTACRYLLFYPANLVPSFRVMNQLILQSRQRLLAKNQLIRLGEVVLAMTWSLMYWLCITALLASPLLIKYKVDESVFCLVADGVLLLWTATAIAFILIIVLVEYYQKKSVTEAAFRSNVIIKTKPRKTQNSLEK